MRYSSLAGLAVAVALVGACSTASYQKQIGKFADGVSDAKTAFETASEVERQGYISTQVHRGMREGNLIKIGKNCQSQPSEPYAGPKSGVDCAPIIVDRLLGDRPLAYKPAAPEGLKFVGLLDDYAKALAQLAAAQDVAALKEGEKAVTAAIGSMAGSFGPPGTGAVVSAGLGIVDWLVGLYLDNQRLQQLRKAVETANPLVAKGSDLVAEQARLMQSSILSKKVADLDVKRSAAYDTHDATKRQAAGEAFIADSLALNDYATMDVGEPFEKLKKAHADLAKALQNPDVDMSAVFTQLKAFATSASNLKTAIDKLRSAK